MTAYLGEITALITAFFWALTSILFTLAGERVGSRVTNRVRLLMAIPMLALVHLAREGTLFPVGVGTERWVWLGLSAVAGLILGDGMLFYAFTQIGARLSMLLMALNPVIGTLLAWLFLDERLETLELVAIFVAISGVAWVVMEQQAPEPVEGVEPEAAPKRYALGVAAGLGGALGQAAGLVLSKQGMSGGADFSPLSASLMRVTIATVIIWLLALPVRQVRPSFTALRDRRALWYVIGGALVGPVLGMTLSLVAIQLSQVGIASTLMALSPILLLPLAHWIFREQVTLRAVTGTLVAMSGVAMIFMS